MNTIKVLLVEDHTMTRLGLQMVLEKADNISVVGEAADGKKGVELAKELLPDVIFMKGANENQLTTAITAVSEGTAWLDPAIAKLVLANIQRQKPQEQKSGSAPNPTKYKEYGLTKREYEVLCLIAEGLDNQEIADRLIVSLSTARAHVHNVLGKLYVADKHKATVLAYKEGLV